jgi:hypothetical protein
VNGTEAQEIPVIRIEPSKGWVSSKLNELWEYRELLHFLTWRDIKVRYKQTALDATWAILQQTDDARRGDELKLTWQRQRSILGIDLLFPPLVCYYSCA